MDIRPAYAKGAKFNKTIFAMIAAIHVLALFAPFTFSWTGLILFLVLYYITGGWGITLCYHRLLTHGSFKCWRPVRYFLTICGCLAMQGSPISWVAAHRLHHKESDHEDDPHSPSWPSFLWSHMLWLFWQNPALAGREEEIKWTRDLWRDRGMRFLHWLFLPMNILCGALLFFIGWAVDSPGFGWSLFIWGFCLRTVFVWHGTWFVNSVTHIWGYRNYTTTDNSRNTWWVALLTFGEGWHNNHHADQRAAAHGHRWWEFDITYYTIKVMSWCGLAWDVVKPRHKDRMLRPPVRTAA